MAGSSSSSPPKWNYDVFLSFRGEDTRKTFTSHLYDGLDRIGIRTFQDDKRLDKGSTISAELCKAIEESQVAIIIFSKNYTSSGWCLDELVKIMECKNNELRQTVIPVFYDVDPSAIRKQTAESFAKHHQIDDKKIQGWKNALAEAAGLTGHDIRNRVEAECIHQIVAQISKLCKPPLSSLKDVVGFNFHLEKVKPLLKTEINDVRIVGIWGMGGVGKTTITRAIFDTFSHQFIASCFLRGVKEIEKRDGLLRLQNILLFELLGKDFEEVRDKDDGRLMMSRRLCSKKVLVVLDDIDHRDHLKYLAGDQGWFGEGSRILVTTRNKQLIGKIDAVYEVTTLPDHEAFQLFNQHAFKDEVPDRRFETLSWKVVNHARGLPLALVVWGSFLNSNQDIHHWRSVVKRMKDCSNSEIVEKLKINYDGLEAQEQQIFLDIACFFRGHRKNDVVQILESFGFEAIVGLYVLIAKSLVFISGIHIEMHDLIQDMGKHVVNMRKDPGERSRIWHAKDFETVMTNNTGTKAVEAIKIVNGENFQLSKKAMKNMNNLRLLHLKQSFGKHMTCDGSSIKYLSNNLCWFVWKYYPAESLPANFEPKRLVHLKLKKSKLRRLWTGQKMLPQLRKMILTKSEELEESPDFRKIPNLEILDLSACYSLKEVHPSLGDCGNLSRLNLSHCMSLQEVPQSLGDCTNLTRLNLRGCQSLKALPSSICKLQKLVELDLCYCTSLEEVPDSLGDCRNLNELIFTHCASLKALPSSICKLQKLKILDLSGCKSLNALPSSIGKLQKLVRLNVNDCFRLESLPEEIGDLENLEELDASYTLISKPPSFIVRLKKLKRFRFQ